MALVALAAGRDSTDCVCVPGSAAPVELVGGNGLCDDPQDASRKKQAMNKIARALLWTFVMKKTCHIHIALMEVPIEIVKTETIDR
jgi:hypothetical protein